MDKERVQMKYKLFNEDCLKVLKLIPDKSIQLILQDPPYNTTACKWEWDIMKKIDEFWYEWKRVIKDNGVIVMTSSQPFTSKLIMSNLSMFRYEWIWDKKRVTNILLSKKQPLRQHENVVVFYDKQCLYNPQPYLKNTKGLLSKKNIGLSHNVDTSNSMLIAGNNEKEYGYPRSLITHIPIINNLSKDKSGLHPTQKPIALFEYLIKTYTNENDMVFDGFAGSGTTGIACLNTNRKFILCETKKEYYDIIKDRIQEKLNEKETIDN